MAISMTIGRALQDQVALEREHHDEREQQAEDRHRRQAGLEPVHRGLAAAPRHEVSGQDAEDERQPEVEDHALGDDPHVELDVPDQQPRVDRDEDHLDDRVERDEDERHRGVAAGQVREDDDHRDARGEAVEDEARVQLRVADEDVREREHHERRHEVVEAEQDEQLARRPGRLPDLVEADVRHRRIHHREQADRDAERDQVRDGRLEGPGRRSP